MATGYQYEPGYDDNRFEFVVSQRFHCPICFLVLKDPVMCKNQHYYCSSCIKKYLENSESCPTCLEHLSIDTLIPGSRIVTDYLSELNIHCDFYPRGCREVIQLADLKRHVASCGFSPVQCSNDGCNVLVNVRDKLHHEAEVCDFRKLKCHDCGQLKKEVREMKDEMKVMKGELKDEIKMMKREMINEVKNEVKDMKDEMSNEMKVMNDQVLVSQGQMQDKITSEIKNEMNNEIKVMRNVIRKEMKEIKEEMKNEIKEIVMNALRDVMAGIKGLEVEMKSPKQSSQATCSSDARENIILVGGEHEEDWRMVKNKSTECFNWADQTWTSLNSAVFEGRSSSSSFMYQGQMVVAGGSDGGNKTNTLKCLNVADPAATWKDFAVNLPVKCVEHKVVIYNDRLYLSGGFVQATDGERSARSDVVREMQLVPPYVSKILTRLPQPRVGHGMEIFDKKLFILGGRAEKVTNNSVQYDLITNKCKEMPPLPYAVSDMATVLWRNNVLVIGGWNERYTPLNTVILYDVITGGSQMLPSMKRKRVSCTAVLTGNVVVVMGGQNDESGYLKSVECFDLERQVWQDLPDMLEPRAFATAVVKPNI